jgi:hypothetical protein
MASLESYAQTASEVLLGSLDYKLPAGASYIVDRRSSQFLTSAAGSFTSDNVRQFRINLTSENGFADLATARLSFRIKNTAAERGLAENIAGGGDTYRVYPKAGPWSFIYRLQVFAAGQPISDIQHYGRLHEMLFRLSPKDWKLQNGALDYTWAPGTTPDSSAQIGFIENGDTATVSMQLMEGIFQSGKMWPLRFAPLSVVCELAPAAYACQEWGLANQTVLNNANAATANVTINAVRTFEIQDPRIHVDIVTLDTGLQNEYAKLLLSGKALTLPINQFVTFNQSIRGTNPVVSITRAASRLRHIFWSFQREVTDVYQRTMSEVNDFTHPTAFMLRRPGAITDKWNYETRWMLGPKLLPEHPIRYTHEYYGHLLKTIGLMWDKEEPIDLSLQHYTTDCHIGAIDCERALGVSWTGLNSRSGDLLTVQFTNLYQPAALGTAAVQDTVPQLHVTLVCEAVVEIRDTSVTLLD